MQTGSFNGKLACVHEIKSRPSICLKRRKAFFIWFNVVLLCLDVSILWLSFGLLPVEERARPFGYLHCVTCSNHYLVGFNKALCCLLRYALNLVVCRCFDTYSTVPIIILMTRLMPFYNGLTTM